ncbi:MAG: ABC transporter permease [Deltaproteobacteria bacterium]|nr:ABC transporter permease [Deltaproteobacteria bacterium]
MSNQIVIEPEKGWLRINFKELFEYRELIGFLAWRDIMAQYKQAVFGVAWAVVKPIFAVIVYSLVFGKVAKLSSSGIPYPLFTLCGLVAWSFFAESLSQSTVSLLNNTNLLTKVYFPRLVLPLSSLGRGVVDFVISFILFLILMGAYGFVPFKAIIFFPFFLAMGLGITLGLGLFLSALCARYHDIKYGVPFLIQMWFWVTPVAYGLENIPAKFKIIFFLNPMTWIIQGFRWSLLGVGEMDWQKMLITASFSIVVLLGGLFYFRRMEGTFADII